MVAILTRGAAPLFGNTWVEHKIQRLKKKCLTSSKTSIVFESPR
jgi:hypothetical protein